MDKVINFLNNRIFIAVIVFLFLLGLLRNLKSRV